MIHREKDPSLKTYLIQIGLKQLGYEPGEPDNWWGPKSEGAYQEFLKSGDDPIGEMIEAPSLTWMHVKATSFADPMDTDVVRP